MLEHHDDRPPGALAHGATKPSDIERVRSDIRQAEERVARRFHEAIECRGQQPGARGQPRDVRIAASAGPASATGERPSGPVEPSSLVGAKRCRSPPPAS